MNKSSNQNRGFTLIELLVVVAIIGLLSSIVLSSLNTARKKSKDAFLREQATQMRNLLEQEYNESGSYYGLQTWAWANDTASCNSLTFTSTNTAFVSQARSICNAIVANSSMPTWNSTGATKFYLGHGSSPSIQSYSIIVGLPYKDAYLCLGSSGAVSDTTTSNELIWSQPGCYSNP